MKLLTLKQKVRGLVGPEHIIYLFPKCGEMKAKSLMIYYKMVENDCIFFMQNLGSMYYLGTLLYL